LILVKYFVYTEGAEDCTFFYEAGNEDHQLGTGSFVHNIIISVVRRVEFVSDWMSLVQYYCCKCALTMCG
jgi:hypothetical protein